MATVDEVYAEGEALKEAGRLPEAVAKFEEAAQMDDGYALAHFALAVVYGQAGRYEDAVRHAERACELEPNEPFSYTALSVTYQRAFAGTRDAQYLQRAEQAMAMGNSLQSGR